MHTPQRALALTLTLLMASSGHALAASAGKIKVCQLDSPQVPASTTLPKDKMYASMDPASFTTGKISMVFLTAPVVVARGQCVVADAIQRPFHTMTGTVPVKGALFRESEGTTSATVIDNFK